MIITIVGSDIIDLEIRGAKCCVLENGKLYVETITGIEAYDLLNSKRVIITDNVYGGIKDDIK